MRFPRVRLARNRGDQVTEAVCQRVTERRGAPVAGLTRLQDVSQLHDPGADSRRNQTTDLALRLRD